MNILLIADSTQWFYYSIAFFLLMLGISISVWAIRTAGCYEHKSDPIGMEPVTYDEIMKNENLCIDFVNN
jgi:hypothetical protein